MTALVSAAPEVPRDRYGRPMIIPPGGGNAVAYTRCTTFVGAIEDTYNLQKWMQRQVALGLSARPDLLLSVSAHRDDKRALDNICEKAREAAASSAAATTGTALHALTELVDNGQELPPVPPGPAASLQKYREAMSGLKVIAMERFTVLDNLQIGGTFDRLVEFNGERYIADIKTGSIDYGALKIAAQLAVYARSVYYDPSTGERSFHEASVNRGIVIHLPATDDPAEARCDLHWFDIETGWEAVLVNRDVRKKRAIKFKDLTAPLEGTLERPSLRLQKKDAAKAEDRNEFERNRARKAIASSTTREHVEAVWGSWEQVWTDELTELAKQRITKIEQENKA